MSLSGKAKHSAKSENAQSISSISMPKGGGAIRGIGEKFASNPVTGTGSMSVPIAVSPGRAGFGPNLAVSYDSGAGQSPFGFGWSLSLPAITRKTDKGLPRYLDDAESDEYLLSGAEDLVPVPMPDGSPSDKITVQGYTIRRYRPRIEGLFARIEHWQHDNGDVHWRSISKDNILTIYGNDANSRIAAPSDPSTTARVYSWLICETRDDKGNAILYEYKKEDGEGIDLAGVHERNRGERDDPSRTANRYLKRIRYGNRTPLLDDDGKRPLFLTPNQIEQTEWMFEVVFDYGEHDPNNPKPMDASAWRCRRDPFSSFRAGFEVRTYRICSRVLMFHHFPEEPNVGKDCLVRSTEFAYEETPFAAFMTQVTQYGFKRTEPEGYVRQSLPPVEFDYSRPVIGQDIREVDPTSMEGLPSVVDENAYQWVDLDGEGLTGILAEQAGSWFYKRNESVLSHDTATDFHKVRLAPAEQVARIPTFAARSQWRLLDLAGDGKVNAVYFQQPLRGYYKRCDEGDWEPFRTFASVPNTALDDPNLKMIDLTGDGHADLLLNEDQAFTWYPSLGEKGFGTAMRVPVPTDEELGPHVIFADGTQTIFLADLSGDGLTDIVRIRNGEVCYWPNLGYGRFGAKITMDNAPWFDVPDQFDPRRIRLVDIDGSGVTDIIYLGRNETRFWLNQSGNAWSQGQELQGMPPVDNVASIAAVDLLGNGTACLVWSSPLPGTARSPMKYISLMAEGKPHLLIKAANNLGAETRIHYAPSTFFYLKDKYDGKPWITKLPFPVHVVERVETIDLVARNRFVSRYAYHHGYFDGTEREFRGFGMVEQWDTESFATLSVGEELSAGDNIDEASHIPPVLTKTWYHTGACIDRGRISNFYTGEFYREPGLTGEQALAMLLPDTLLPEGLSTEEEREACRALKGSMLRQEVYAQDGSVKEEHPYSVTEQNFTVRRLYERGDNRHPIFFVHPLEAIQYHYDRNPADPRVSHTLTLEVDNFGNVLKETAIGYGRRKPDPDLIEADQRKQTISLITYTENHFTDPIDDPALYPNAYRSPLPYESSTFELTGYAPTGQAGRYRETDFVQKAGGSRVHRADSGLLRYEEAPSNGMQRRLIEHARTLYRKDDLSALFELGKTGPLALPGENFKLAFTSSMLDQAYRRNGDPLLPHPADVLGEATSDGGGYMSSQSLKATGAFPGTDPDDHWWISAGRTFLSPNGSDDAAQERDYARKHFYLTCRYRDPFHTGPVSTESLVTYDSYDLFPIDVRDPAGNRVTAGERLPDGQRDPAKAGIDYRVLQPWRVMDLNRNRTETAFDILGMVSGVAVKGKPEENLGDTLDGFEADLSDAAIHGHMADPLADPIAILKSATSRIVYDLFAYLRTKNQPNPQPAVVYSIARETHAADLMDDEKTKLQLSFTYSDGFGREIQKKIQAEPEKTDGVTQPPRWVGSGWAIFNNKGKPVRQYEPFFSLTPHFEFGVQVGVSPVLFYDPVGRVVVTLHPNNVYEKVVFDPWRQMTYDVNDICAPHGTQTGDPRTDPDIRVHVERYFASLPADVRQSWQTWYVQRQGGGLGAREKIAADKAAEHADTPTAVYFDALGRPFLTRTHNGYQDNDPILFDARIELDIEGNQRVIRDAVEQQGDKLGRIVMRYTYDMLGNLIHQASMEAGERWILNDAAGKPIRSWNSIGRAFRNEYDPLRRLLRVFVTGADPEHPDEELLTERLVYGEQHPEAELCSLRGKLFLHFDQVGAAASDAFDFKGNLVRSSRRLANNYKTALDWSTVDVVLPADPAGLFDPLALEAIVAPLMEADLFTNLIDYNALNRPVLLKAPHAADLQPSVIRNGYNEAGLLERVDVNLYGENANGVPVWKPYVTNIDYDAKGQRQRIDYGNCVSTFYEHDPLTFRLVSLRTVRNVVLFPEDNRTPPMAGWPGNYVQNLSYTYDPAGNIVHIHDDAQQTVYFRNKRVEPSADYTYDPLYRLIEATGREHLGQVGGVPIPHSHNDAPRAGIDWSANDGNAMGTYTERFVYDAVGNFLMMQHRGSDPVHPGWSRQYTYEETSLLEDGTGGTLQKNCNRLSSTTVSGDMPAIERYKYDAHGNFIFMPHLGIANPGQGNMHWNYRDQLRRTDLGGGGTAYYVYDSEGQRVRKVWEKTKNLIEERIYLGGYEIFRRRDGMGEVKLERETLHIMDDKQRVALVETRTPATTVQDDAPQQLIRYQFGNHLGSACLELDDHAQIISYEEYTPYGSTSYQAVRSQAETPKRYRYTGKERDKESGLYYHSARYYAPWLGRWTATDPLGINAGINLFVYTRNNPIKFNDPSGMKENGVNDDESKVCSVSSGDSSAASVSSSTNQTSDNAGGSVAASTSLAMSSAQYQVSRAARPVDVSGKPLSGTYYLWSGEANKNAAKDMISKKGGWLMSQTPEHVAAANNFASALRKEAATKFPGKSFTDQELFSMAGSQLTLQKAKMRAVWDPPSAKVATEAVIGGLPVQGNVISPPGPETVQSRIELPAVKKAGALMGNVQIGAGALNVYGGMQEQDPLLSTLGIGGGSMQIAGGATLAFGAARASAPIMLMGTRLSTVGALVTAPITLAHAAEDLKSDELDRQLRGTLDTVGIVAPPAAFLSAYNELFTKPAATQFYETARGAVSEAFGLPLSWVR